MILAVDVGGTQTKYAVLDDSGHFVPPFPESMPTAKKDFLKQLTALVENVSRSFPVKAVGISIAANVSREGTVLHATNLPILLPLELGRVLSERLGLPVKVENDGNCAALGVFHFLKLPEDGTFVVMTLGTGVGGGIIYRGKLLDSGSGAASELGHIVIDPAGPLCGCGKRGCLEALIGESALVERYNLTGIRPVQSAVEISKQLAAGDEAALALVQFAGEQLGRGMAVVSDIMAPQAFYLGGGVSGLGEPLLDAARAGLAENCFLRLLGRVPTVERVPEQQLLSLKGAWVLAS